MATIRQKVRIARRIEQVRNLAKAVGCYASIDHASNIVVEGTEEAVGNAIRLIEAYGLGKLNAPTMTFENRLTYAIVAKA